MHDVRPELARIRSEAGLSQSKIAALIGIMDQGHVSRIENGHATTTVEKAVIWADACGYDLTLVRRDDPDAHHLAAELVAAPAGQRATLLRLLRLLPRLTEDGLRIVSAFVATLDDQQAAREREEARTG